MSHPGRWVADLGGSRGRFARLEADGSLGPRVEIDPRTVPDFSRAIERVEGELGRARAVALAVAGPVVSDAVELTNADWSFAGADLRRRFGWSRLVVLNDFEALARGLAAVGEPEVEMVRPGRFDPASVRAVLGPGTGLGVTALVPTGADFHPLASEGGHRDLAAANAREWQVVGDLLRRHGDATAERVLSGPGLAELHRVLHHVPDESEKIERSEVIGEMARRGDPLALETVTIFSALLGAFAGDLVLTLGARGGLYLAGGVLAGLGGLFDRQAFETRFLAKPEIFQVQLRALLRAGIDGELWIMAPLVSRVEEVRLLKAALAEVEAELDREGLARSRSYRVGIMIEVPAAAQIADLLAREVDFFAIGTNDLIQYSIAVDRNNQEVADLYQPLHPAILRMLRFVATSAAAAGIPVSICGEMGGDARYTALLVGLGIRRISAHPRSIRRLRRVVREIDAGRMREVADACCDLETAEVVEAFLEREGAAHDSAG